MITLWDEHLSFTEKLEIINADSEWAKKEDLARMLSVRGKETTDTKFEILESNCD